MGQEWKPATDRMVLNDALTKLTKEWDFDTALLVIKEFDSLPSLVTHQTKRLFVQTKQIDGPSENSEIRLGYFKIFKMTGKNPNLAAIVFGSFFKDSEPLLGFRPPSVKYQLVYKTASKLPYGLYRIEWVKTRPSPRMHLIALVEFLRTFRTPRVFVNWKSKRIPIHVC